MSVEREEAKEVFKTIIAYYPQFNSKGTDEYRKDFADKWITKISKGDFNLTMKKLDTYSDDSPFPPALADILAYPPRAKFTQDYSEDYKKVIEEKSNPETAKLREEKLKKLKAAMGGVLGD